MPDAFFHIDNERTLKKGQVLGLQQRPVMPKAATSVADCLDDTYPNGYGTYGFHYLFSSNGEDMVFTEQRGSELGYTTDETRLAMSRSRNRMLEFVFEMTRLKFFPDRPSRLAAVFAYRELSGARKARVDDFGDPTAPIWEVEADAHFDCDSGWLRLDGDIIQVLLRATEYWKGTPSPYSTPDDKETLLVPPVTVVKLGPA